MTTLNTITIKAVKATLAVSTTEEMNNLIEEFQATFTNGDNKRQSEISGLFKELIIEDITINNSLLQMNGELKLTDDVWVMKDGKAELFVFAENDIIDVKSVETIEVSDEDYTDLICEGRADFRAKELMEKYNSDTVTINYKMARKLTQHTGFDIISYIKLQEKILNCKKGSKTLEFLTSLQEQFDTWANTESKYKNPWSHSQYQTLMEILYPNPRG